MRFARFVLCFTAALNLSAQTTYRIATAGRLGNNGDGGPATQASLLFPRGVAVGPDGAIFVSENGSHRVRRIAPNGIVTTYAGTGAAGLAGDGGPAVAAQISSPTDLAIDQKGNLYILDSGNGRVRRVGPDGTIQSVAGKGGCGSNVAGPATNLAFCTLAGLTLDSTGTLYVSEEDGTIGLIGHRVWRVDSSGMATVFAGAEQGLEAPTSIAFDPSGNLYIVDLGFIKRRDPSGSVTEIAGAYTGLDHILTNVPAKGQYISEPTALATDSQGAVYFSTGFGEDPAAVFAIRNGTLSFVAGVDQFNSGAYGGDGDPHLYLPGGLAFDSSGNMYITEYYGHRLRRLTPGGGALTTVAGTRTLPAGSTAPLFRMASTQAVAAAPDGSIYFADWPLAEIKKIAPDGSVSLAAGNGNTVVSGDGGPATVAGIGGSLNAIALDANGNLFLHSYSTYRIREVSPYGTIDTVVGTGQNGSPLSDVAALAADGSGGVYYADSKGLHHQYQGTSTLVSPQEPSSIALSPSGVVHFLFGQSVYRFDGVTATVVAGGATNSKAGSDGVPATQAFLPWPSAIAFDGGGNLYIAGQLLLGGPGVAWRVGSDGILRLIAGPADGPESPDGTPAASAAFSLPRGIAVDASGNVFLAAGPELKALVPDSSSACRISVSTGSLDVPLAGGGFNVQVKASAYLCPYGVNAPVSWIKPSVAGASGNGSLTLTVDANTGAARQATVTIGMASVTIRQAGTALAIGGPATLSAGAVGTAYSATLTVTGGAPPYTWSVSAGVLPAGVTLLPSGTILERRQLREHSRLRQGSRIAAARRLHRLSA